MSIMICLTAKCHVLLQEDDKKHLQFVHDDNYGIHATCDQAVYALTDNYLEVCLEHNKIMIPIFDYAREKRISDFICTECTFNVFSQYKERKERRRKYIYGKEEVKNVLSEMRSTV